MLEAARNRFAGLSYTVRCANADYGAASWIASADARGPFDAIVSGYSIHHQPDGRKREVYREIFGLLAPGGLDQGRLAHALDLALGAKVDGADLYFQASQEESWALEDGIVKEGSPPALSPH